MGRRREAKSRAALTGDFAAHLAPSCTGFTDLALGGVHGSWEYPHGVTSVRRWGTWSTHTDGAGTHNATADETVQPNRTVTPRIASSCTVTSTVR
jgi:hypothetical protein